jgi:hypothetical protein
VVAFFVRISESRTAANHGPQRGWRPGQRSALAIGHATGAANFACPYTFQPEKAGMTGTASDVSWGLIGGPTGGRAALARNPIPTRVGIAD